MALQDTYIKNSFQFSEYGSEIQQLKNLNARLNERLSQKSSEIDELKASKENINLKLLKSISALNCKCICRCGARKSEANDNEEYADIRQLKAEHNKLREEKKYYSGQLEEKVEKLTKLQLEMEVSEERFIKSRAFKSLINQARSIVKNMENLKKNNEDLQKINDDFNDAKCKEIKNILAKEEEKRNSFETQIQAMHSKISNIERERDEALSSINLWKKEKIHQKTTVNFKFIIEDLEDERNRLKKQIAESSKEKAEISSRLEEEQKKVNELRDVVMLKEIEITKLHKDEPIEFKNDDDLNSRLRDYRNEVLELKNQIKNKDLTISKNESNIRQIKQDLKIEKRNNDFLISEIEVTGNAYEETMKKNKLLAAQLVEQEQSCIQLMNERLRENCWKVLMEKQQGAFEDQLQAKENLIAQLQDVIKEEQKVSNNRLDALNALEGKFKAIEQKLSYMNNSHNENTKKYEELLNCKKELQDKLREAEKICVKNATESIQFKFLYEYSERCWKENEEKMILMKESQFLQTKDEMFLEEFNKYRELIRCTQCKTRNKDCLINKCFHLFCRRCIEFNLSQQRRKCPNCSTKFTSDDIRTFYWR